MKTEAEIYKACVDAGLKAGDLVRMNNGARAPGTGKNLSVGTTRLLNHALI